MRQWSEAAMAQALALESAEEQLHLIDRRRVLGHFDFRFQPYKRQVHDLGTPTTRIAARSPVPATGVVAVRGWATPPASSGARTSDKTPISPKLLCADNELIENLRHAQHATRAWEHRPDLEQGLYRMWRGAGDTVIA